MRWPLTPSSPDSRLQCFDLAQRLRRSEPGCRPRTSPPCKCLATEGVSGEPLRRTQIIAKESQRPRTYGVQKRPTVPAPLPAAELQQKNGSVHAPTRALNEEPLPWGREQDPRELGKNVSCQPPLPTTKFSSRAFLDSNPGVLKLV